MNARIPAFEAAASSLTHMGRMARVVLADIETAAFLQQQYDEAVEQHGAHSAQALEAEQQAREYFNTSN